VNQKQCVIVDFNGSIRESYDPSDAIMGLMEEEDTPGIYILL